MRKVSLFSFLVLTKCHDSFQSQMYNLPTSLSFFFSLFLSLYLLLFFINSYTSVINAISKSGDVDAPRRAERMLVQMTKLDNVSPNRLTYNSVINCWCRSAKRWRGPGSSGTTARGINEDEGAAARGAEAVLMKMKELSRAGVPGVRPDSVTYTTVINTLANAGGKGAARRAEEILQMMEMGVKENEKKRSAAQIGKRRQREDGTNNDSGNGIYDKETPDCRPNVFTYVGVLNALARSGEEDASRRALSILDRMEEEYHAGNTLVKPNQHCYNAGKKFRINSVETFGIGC